MRFWFSEGAPVYKGKKLGHYFKDKYDLSKLYTASRKTGGKLSEKTVQKYRDRKQGFGSSEEHSKGGQHMKGLDEKLQEYGESMEALKRFQDLYSEEEGGEFFDSEDLMSFEEFLGTLDQDSTIDDITFADAHIERLSGAAMAYLNQADPDAPPIGKMRTPEMDGVTGTGIEDPYPHPFKEIVEHLGKVAGGVKGRSGNKITFGNGATIELPTQSKGPQQIESGDNPDSYKSQDDLTDEDIEAILNEKFAPAEEAASFFVEKLQAVSAAMEAREVKNMVQDFVSGFGDTALQRGARACMQGCETVEDFDARKCEFMRTAEAMSGGKSMFQSKIRTIGFNIGEPEDTPLY